jgi:hypothetical protein
MNKYYFGARWKPTRRQIIASYRLSASKHAAEQLGENHLNAGANFGLHSPEYRQHLRQLMHRLKRIAR